MSGNDGDVGEDGADQRLAAANPYDPVVLDAHLPPRSGELMLREITAGRRPSFLDRLGVRGAPGLPTLSGRAAFAGVVAAIALAAIGLNIGLASGGRDVALPGATDGSAGFTEVDEADSSLADPVPPTIAESESDSESASTGAPTPTEQPAQPTPTDPVPGAADPDDGGDSPAVSSAPTVPPPTTDDDIECITLEAEQFELTGGWRIGYDNRVGNGAFITWEGLAPEEHNSSPTDVLEVEIAITNPGTYRFVWAMRQPVEVGDDSANASWVNFPDAARFGPIDGGSYGGFVEVYGNAKGEFDWTATAQHDGEQSAIGVVFDTADTYTVQLAGRSHGHEIDQIVLYRDSVSEDDAIAGRCRAIDR